MSDAPDDLDDEPVILMSTKPKNPIDPVEGTSTEVITLSDDSSDDSAPSTSTPKQSEGIVCETCHGPASLTIFKQKLAPNGNKQEDIFRNYCSSCDAFFGLCSKKVRGTFSYVNEDGRILTNSEKMEHFQAEKRKIELSRADSDMIPAEETPPSDFSATGDDNEPEEPEQEEPVEQESEPSPEKAEPKIEPKKKMTARKSGNNNLFGGKRAKTNWSNSGRIKRKQAEKEKRMALGIVEQPKTSSVKKPAPKKRISEEKKTSAPSTSEDKKRGRPPKHTSSSKNSLERVPSDSFIAQTTRTRETADSEAQTDDDMLLKSTYLSDIFEDTSKKILGEHIASRLQGQPLILRKQFMMMLRTIQVQETQLEAFRGTEKKYKEAVEALRNFGRTTRLTISDDLRNIRTDVIERKTEFKMHQMEVQSVLRKQRDKYEKYKEAMDQKYEGHKLEMENLQAKLAYAEEEKKFEFERAEYLLRKQDVYRKEKNEAKETAEEAVKNLNDRLFVANNEKCTHCQTVDKVRRKMMTEVAEMTEKMDTAVAERNQAFERAGLFESAAQKLGKDCDTIKYERDSWKAYAEKYKKDVNKLTQNVKELEKELAEKALEIEKVAASTPKNIITPKSVACTPNDMDRVSPPEEGEIIDTPPQASPANPSAKSTPKPLAQKVAKTSLPIAAGFESWIPKDKIDAPAPSIPKALTAFGPPIKTPQQREAEKRQLVISHQQTPWERAAMPQSASDSLTEALSKVQAETFFNGTGAKTPTYSSKSYSEEISRMIKARKRVSDAPAEDQKKPQSQTSTPVPPIKKPKPSSPVKMSSTTPSYNFTASVPSTSTAGPSIGSLSNMRKIPKLSERPPQPEFAPALGIRDEAFSGIPGLDDEKVVEKAAEKQVEPNKIQPAAPIQTAPPKKVEPVNLPKPVVEKPAIQKPASATPAALKPTTPVKTATPSTSSSSQQQQQNKNKNNGPNHDQSTSKKQKKKKKNNISPWEHPKHADPWDNRPQMNSPWGRPIQQTNYGIQSQPQRYAGFGDDRLWSDSSQDQRNRMDTDSFSSLPWHRPRAQDTPFGKVPIQDTSYGIGGPSLGPQSFYSSNLPDQSGFYNSCSSQHPPRYSPPTYPPPHHPPPPNRNPRSFYG